MSQAAVLKIRFTDRFHPLQGRNPCLLGFAPSRHSFSTSLSESCAELCPHAWQDWFSSRASKSLIWQESFLWHERIGRETGYHPGGGRDGGPQGPEADSRTKGQGEQRARPQGGVRSSCYLFGFLQIWEAFRLVTSTFFARSRSAFGECHRRAPPAVDGWGTEHCNVFDMTFASFCLPVGFEDH